MTGQAQAPMPLDGPRDAHQRLATLVRTRRQRRGLSQAALATASQTSRDVIKRLESGRGDARLSVVLAVLPVLGCTARELHTIVYGSQTRDAQNTVNKSRQTPSQKEEQTP